MTQAQIAAALRTRFRDQVATPQSLSTVYDNQAASGQTSRWCMFSVLFESEQQVQMGAPTRWRIRGRGVALLFTPIGTVRQSGDGDQLVLVDAIRNAFRGVQINAGTDLAPVFVTFDAPTATGVAEQDEQPQWWLRAVQIPFRADHFGSG